MSRGRQPLVAALTVHPPRIAATRLRITQYADHIANAGLDLRVWTLFRDQDVAAWYGPSTGRRLAVLLRGLLRLPAAVLLVLRAEVVLVHREVLPFGPPLIELLAARTSKLVWDLDDAVWRQREAQTAGRVPRWLRAPAGKFEHVCRRASGVWAGSDVLADWCRQHSDVVSVVPTVVAVPALLPPEPEDPTVIGWVGTHSTGPFLEAILPSLVGVQPTPLVVVVGADVQPPDGLHVEQHGWSPASEEQMLQRIRVGLYPVDRDHVLAEGKCGLKAILYLAHGVPVVTTPTRTNAVIVRDGVDGLHADTPAAWTAAVQRLLTDSVLRARLRAAGWARVEQEYSLRVWGPRVADVLRELAGARSTASAAGADK